MWQQQQDEEGFTQAIYIVVAWCCIHCRKYRLCYVPLHDRDYHPWCPCQDHLPF